MSSQRESTARTLTVALLVCLVCSIFVAGAAVALRPTQTENRLLDKQRSILAIAQLGDASMTGAQVKQMFDTRIQARVVDLETGKFSDNGNNHVCACWLSTSQSKTESASELESLHQLSNTNWRCSSFRLLNSAVSRLTLSVTTIMPFSNGRCLIAKSCFTAC